MLLRQRQEVQSLPLGRGRGRRKGRTRLRSLLFFFVAACSSDGAGNYFCIIGNPDNRIEGSCSATEAACKAKITAASVPDPLLRCETVKTIAYEVRWTGKYGAMEAWYRDQKTCETRAKQHWGTDAPCVAAPWEKSGKRAH